MFYSNALLFRFDRINFENNSPLTDGTFEVGLIEKTTMLRMLISQG